jgi:transcriptional antiterminator RfaH
VHTQSDERPPWFALYVKAKHEKTVATLLGGKGLETFLPTYRRHHKKSKHFDLPLFPGYVFCRFESTKMLPVISTPGVFLVVGNGQTPEPISEAEIGNIRRMILSGTDPCPWPYVAEGNEVCVTSGPLRGLQGLIVDTSQEKWLVVSMNLLHRSVAVKLHRDSVVVDPSASDSPAQPYLLNTNRMAM